MTFYLVVVLCMINGSNDCRTIDDDGVYPTLRQCLDVAVDEQHLNILQHAGVADALAVEVKCLGIRK